MAESRRLVTAGRVGRPHGLDGSFALREPRLDLQAATRVVIAGRDRTVAHRTGSAARPLIRLKGVDDREGAAALNGELVLIEQVDAPLGEGEWLARDLIGCRVDGLGSVARIVGGPSCDVLELDGGQLVPFVSDAIRTVDVDAGRITVDRGFLGLEEERG